MGARASVFESFFRIQNRSSGCQASLYQHGIDMAERERERERESQEWSELYESKIHNTTINLTEFAKFLKAECGIKFEIPF